MKTGSYLAIAFLGIFGLVTLFLSSSIIFDWFGIRAKEGNFVWVVVWSNFVCSFLYLYAMYGWWYGKTNVSKVLTRAALVLGVGLALMFEHISTGGAYETKTIGAMLFRIAVTGGLAWYANKSLAKS